MHVHVQCMRHACGMHVHACACAMHVHVHVHVHVPGIIDALSVGCVPVLFHPRQAELWPHHWRGTRPCHYPTTPQ